MIEIYTDGSCSHKGRSGGWAAIVINDEWITEIAGFENDTTTSRVELLAAIKALEFLKNPSCVNLYSDSQYVVNAFTKGWLKNWLKAGLDSRINYDLWYRLHHLDNFHTIYWQWVRGHSNVYFNEKCDVLAGDARINRKNHFHTYRGRVENYVERRN